MQRRQSSTQESLVKTGLGETGKTNIQGGGAGGDHFVHRADLALEFVGEGGFVESDAALAQLSPQQGFVKGRSDICGREGGRRYLQN